jgi:hypothetical protein
MPFAKYGKICIINHGAWFLKKWNINLDLLVELKSSAETGNLLHWFKILKLLKVEGYDFRVDREGGKKNVSIISERGKQMGINFYVFR